MGVGQNLDGANRGRAYRQEQFCVVLGRGAGMYFAPGHVRRELDEHGGRVHEEFFRLLQEPSGEVANDVRLRAQLP